MATQKVTKAPGDLDSNFGSEGVVIYYHGWPPNPATPFRGSSKLLSDGKIFTVGFHIGDFVLVRHLSNGELDESFGDHGIKLIKFMPGVRVRRCSLTLQSNGRALIFGTAGAYSETIGYVVRLLPDGKLDASFGKEGRVLLDLTPGSDVVNALAIQPDGKIVLAVTSQRDSFHTQELLLRLDSNGVLDPTFGKAGMVFVGLGEFRSIIALPDNRVLLAGTNFSIGSDYGALWFRRYLSDGGADRSFGDNGLVTVDIKSSLSVHIEGALRQRDGKVVVAGYVNTESMGYQTLTTRINPDGSLDDTFNNGVPVVISFPDFSRSYGVAIQPDNKILTAGTTGGNFMLMRFLSDGVLDMEFGSQGKVVTDNEGTDIAREVAVQTDGKIVMSGWLRIGTGHGIARYLG